MWRAFDFLVVCGRWEPFEIVTLTERHQNGQAVMGAFPEAHGRDGCVSLLEIRMLESPRTDLAPSRPTSRVGECRSLDDCLNDVVAVLYDELQDRI